MARCPSCGASSLFGFYTKQCANCGKIVCDQCVPQWFGPVRFKTYAENTSTQPARYETTGFCSVKCFGQFWDKILDYQAEPQIGTDMRSFGDNVIVLWNKAIVNAFAKGNPNAARSLVPKADYAVQIHSDRFPAFPWWDSSGKLLWMFERFRAKAKTSLAQNLEKCGRIDDAAKVYEDLRMYDKARELRERDRQILVRKTDVSVNLNALLQQVKDGGIVAIFRCPRCGGKLKIGDKTTLNSLKVCEHCGSEIESMDLADFLKAALS